MGTTGILLRSKSQGLGISDELRRPRQR